MFETIRDAARMGLGAISLSKDNLKKLTDNLVEIGKVSREEGERLFKEFSESADDYKKNMTTQIEEVTEKVITEAGLARKSEVEELKARVAELESRLKEKEG
ncbi:hypothetical protein MNBD_NITROSPINAE02-701 [hydrothermal vent metagenome]|uniref:Phasin domain-containing protein n=1 Tax=hydrothermal vent metagenome TaxID=652676 RepID=A0A3B1CDH1_9ZZZZ